MTERSGQNEIGALNAILLKAIASISVSIPATVTAFDADTQTVTAKPNIRRVRTLDALRQTLDVPEVINVPLIYPFAQVAGFALTLPISAGDQVLLIVADRSIDNWVDNSGVQDPHESANPRMHDLTDSLAIVGATPNPLALSDYQTAAIELRNASRETRVTLSNDAVEVVQGGNSIILNATGLTLTFGGTSIALDGTSIDLTGVLRINGSPYLGHAHSGVQTGGGNTGGVVV